MSNLIVRELKEEDADNFFDLNLVLDQETEFMMWEPEERESKKEVLIEYFKKVPTIKSMVQLVAVKDDKLIGHVAGMIGGKNRVKHSLYIFMGVLQDYCGQGVGTKLLQEDEDRARELRIERLELTCDHDNEVGNKLYMKVGYQVEGRKIKAIKTKTAYKDLIMYAKFIH